MFTYRSLTCRISDKKRYKQIFTATYTYLYIFRNGLIGFIVGNKRKRIFQTDLDEIPNFLRFETVNLWYRSSGITIAEKCELFVNYLLWLKMALNDSKLIHLICTVNPNGPNNFKNHFQLLEHVQNELLPICESSRGFKFEIEFYSSADTNLIESLLQMPPIYCCSNVEIELYEFSKWPIQLPVESISGWLHPKFDGNNGKSKERFLRICSYNFQNAWEMRDHLILVIKPS